jgi:hypothetical protein
MGDPSAFLSSIAASVQDLTNNNQNLGKNGSALQSPVADCRLSVSAIPLLSSLPTCGATLSTLGKLGRIIQIPTTASTGNLSLSNPGLQNGIVNYITGFLQTNFNIITSLSQIFALATGEFLPGQSADVCTLASQLNTVSTITNQVGVLSSALQQLVLALRMCSLLSKWVMSHYHSRIADQGYPHSLRPSWTDRDAAEPVDLRHSDRERQPRLLHICGQQVHGRPDYLDRSSPDSEPRAQQALRIG